MNIETAQLGQGPRQYIGEESTTILELDNDPLFQFASNVRYKLTAQRFVAELLVRGVVEVDVRACCVRCGEGFTRTVRDEEFARSYPLSSAAQFIDLTADIREAILLAFPANFVCSADCRGLCVHCGANLNKGSCGCSRARQATSWDALDQLNWKC